MKVYENGDMSHEEAPTRRKDWKVTYFNRKFDVDFNTIDYSYYISKTRELVEMFQDRNLFD